MENTDIGCSDHYLVWMELSIRVDKGAIRKWCLDKFEVEEVKPNYQRASEDDMHEDIR